MPPDPIAFLNGRFVPPSELTLAPHDAGFVFGAAVTDFCRTYRHELFRWADHLARFRRDCAACRVPLPYPDAELTAAADRLVGHNAPLLGPVAELALVTFATPGPLGYMVGLPDNGPPTVGMHTFRLPVGRYGRFFAEGVTLVVADGPGPVLPGAKHRSRLPWWMADRAVGEAHPGAVPVLLGPDGAPDTPLGAVLGVVGGAVVRPPPGAVLEGVSVGVVGELCGQLGLEFRTGPLGFPDVDGSVTELLLAGSGFGLAGVRRLIAGGRTRDYPWPGPVLGRLQEAWQQL